MKEKKPTPYFSWKFILVYGLFFLALLWQAGCVDISDTKVQVQPPGQVDQFNRSIVDQCTPHVLPHRLIQGSIGSASPFIHSGGGLMTDQATFDQWWTGLTVQLDQNKVVSQNSKPLIDWTRQIVSIVVIPMNNACQRARPYGDEMTTDCYQVSIPIYVWNEGENCQDVNSDYPVFIYIYPIVNLPVNVVWISPSLTPTFTPIATVTSTPSPTPTPTPEDDE